MRTPRPAPRTEQQGLLAHTTVADCRRLDKLVVPPHPPSSDGPVDAPDASFAASASTRASGRDVQAILDLCKMRASFQTTPERLTLRRRTQTTKTKRHGRRETGDLPMVQPLYPHLRVRAFSSTHTPASLISMLRHLLACPRIRTFRYGCSMGPDSVLPWGVSRGNQD